MTTHPLLEQVDSIGEMTTQLKLVDTQIMALLALLAATAN